MSDSLPPRGLWPARLLCPWDSPGENTGVGCHFLFQGIFQTQREDLFLLRPLRHELLSKNPGCVSALFHKSQQIPEI